MSPPLPLVGEDFAGYRLRSVLGRGGMSVVFEAENPRLGSVVALKVLAPELAADDLFRTRFLQESRVAASLNHPNVIPVYDAGPSEGLLYIAMRYVAGRDLRAVLDAHEFLSPAQALMLLSQAGRALDAAHRHGLVHRDVKPANILIERGADDEPDHVYLADFGITKPALSREGLTAPGQLVGTIDYIAPEQIQGGSVDGRADIYSLGCVLYECLTGRVPFMKDLDAAVIWAHVEETPMAPSALRAELPRGIDEVLARALAKAPAERYPTAHEFMGAARTALETVPQSSASASPEGAMDMVARTVLTGASAPRPMPPAPAPDAVPIAPSEPSGLREPPASLVAPVEEPPGAGLGYDPPAAGPPPAESPADAEDPSPGTSHPVEESVAATALSAPDTGSAQMATPDLAHAPDVGATALSAPGPSAEQTATPNSPGPPPQVPQSPVEPAPPGDQAGPAPAKRTRRGLAYAAALLVLIAGAVAVLLQASGSGTPAGKLSSTALGEVPTNHVTGSGEATISLNGNRAAVTVTTTGLDSNSELVHLMHIHAGGKGECPPASAARLHNGHLSISTTDGINYYGPAVTSLTLSGDTSPASILAFPRFPSGGDLHYKRTIVLPESVAADIRRNNAVIVVHGTDYDGSGIYSGVLDRSELNASVPGTATAPALCGRLISAQSTAAAGARSSGRRLLYSASLRTSAAESMPMPGVFYCHVAETTAALPETRREGGTSDAA
jgi:Protein kinase domain